MPVGFGACTTWGILTFRTTCSRRCTASLLGWWTLAKWPFELGSNADWPRGYTTSGTARVEGGLSALPWSEHSLARAASAASAVFFYQDPDSNAACPPAAAPLLCVPMTVDTDCRAALP